MSDPQVALLMMGLFIFIIMLGFPIAFTLMAMGVGFGYYAYFQPGQAIFDNRVFYLLTQNTFSVMNNDVLVAVPLFLFMGYVIERANILDQLFHSLQMSLRAIPGSMAVAALITCALFATATGIVGAVVTLMGLLALPAMLKAGYDQKTRHRCHLRRRHARHPHPAVDHADRLCCDRSGLRGQAVRGGADPRLPAGRPVHRLRDRRARSSIRR